MKMRKMYTVPGTNLADSDSDSDLRAFADKMGHQNIELREITVPWLDDGDNITINLHRGGGYDENSIHSGGSWLDVSGIFHTSGSHVGWMGNANGQHIQSMDRDMRYNGFPYRNVRIA